MIYAITTLWKITISFSSQSGQVDSPELPETPEITEMTKKFTEVTQCLTKFKETVINMFGKNLASKSSENKICCGFRVFECSMAKNENPEMPEIYRKLSKLKRHTVLTVSRYQKTAKKAITLLCKYNFGLNNKKLSSSFNGKFSVITLSNTLRGKS